MSLLLSLGAALGLGLLLVLEQQRSSRSSDTVVLYLAVSIICDVLLLTMQSGISALSKVSHPVIARCTIHLLLLILECCNNGYPIHIASDPKCPEESYSVLVGIIHAKAMESPSIEYDDGEATTLMSTDADSLDGIAGMVHETWAQVIEVLIGIRLLAIEVGWIWPLPLFLIYREYLARLRPSD
ncbi:hypothetical protein ACMFMG_000964 [Clarireedia jacksonii]